MVKVKVPKSERRKWQKLLKNYYPGNYRKAIISKAAESHVTLSESDVNSFFSKGIVKWANVILLATEALIEEAKNKEADRSERFQILAKPLSSTGTL